MSSQIRKLQTRVELKEENAWLKNAFRQAYGAAQEQSENAAELTRFMWAVAHANGGELRIPKSALATMPNTAKLLSGTDEETGELVFIAHDGKTLDAKIIENIGDEQATPENDA